MCLRITDLSSRWSGVLRLGFSAHNPAIVGNGGGLPKYACPDLTSRPGYWAKALAESFTERNVLVQYHVSANGDVHFAINGQGWQRVSQSHFYSRRSILNLITYFESFSLTYRTFNHIPGNMLIASHLCSPLVSGNLPVVHCSKWLFPGKVPFSVF